MSRLFSLKIPTKIRLLQVKKYRTGARNTIKKEEKGDNADKVET